MSVSSLHSDKFYLGEMDSVMHEWVNVNVVFGSVFTLTLHENKAVWSHNRAINIYSARPQSQSCPHS